MSDCTGTYAYERSYVHDFRYACEPGSRPWRICLNCGLVEEKGPLLWPPGDPYADLEEQGSRVFGDKLVRRIDPWRARAVDLFAAGASVAEVADLVGVSVRTLTRLRESLGGVYGASA